MSVLLASEIQHLEPKRPVTKTPMGAEKNKNNPTNSPEKPSVSSQRPGTGKPSNSEAVWKRCTLAQHHRKSMRLPTPDGGRGAPRRCLRAGARDGSGELGPSLVVIGPRPVVWVESRDPPHCPQELGRPSQQGVRETPQGTPLPPLPGSRQEPSSPQVSARRPRLLPPTVRRRCPHPGGEPAKKDGSRESCVSRHIKVPCHTRNISNRMEKKKKPCKSQEERNVRII